MRKYFLEMGFWGRLFVFVSLATFLLVFAAIVGDIVAFYVFGKDAMVRMDAPVLQLLQTFMAVGLFLLPPVLMVRLCCDGSWGGNLMVSRRPKLLQLLVCIAAVIAASPLVSWLEDVNLQMSLPESMSSVEDWMREREASAAKTVEKLTSSPDPWCFVANILVLALLPGLCEEMFFRVGVQTRLFDDKTRIRGYWSVVLTAVLFSAFHLQFFGFLPRFALGVVLGIFLLLTGNAWYSVLAHFVNNMVVVTAAYMTARGVEMSQPQWLATWWAALLSALALSGLIVLLNKIEKKSKNAL